MSVLDHFAAPGVLLDAAQVEAVTSALRRPVFDDTIIALYARGLTIREIQSFSRDILGVWIEQTEDAKLVVSPAGTLSSLR